MISDARGRHVSPGVYTEEKDVTYSVKSLGITSLGLVGETLKGPAFQNIEIEDWSTFVDYFGGTSTEKFKKNGRPRYELPYIAKEYLQKSQRLNVVRVLGLSGYNAGPAWIMYQNEHPILILRSKMSYSNASENSVAYCEKQPEVATPLVQSIESQAYVDTQYDSVCAKTTPSTSKDPVKDPNEKYKLGIKVTTKDNTYVYNVSLNSKDRDYIYRVLGTSPVSGEAPVYIESLFEGMFDKDEPFKEQDGNKFIKKEDAISDVYYQIVKDGTKEVSGETKDTYKFQEISTKPTSYKTYSGTMVTVGQKDENGKLVDGFTEDELKDKNLKVDDYVIVSNVATPSYYTSFYSPFSSARTPWIVSNASANGSKHTATMKKLFRVITIADGNSANYQVKISIQNIDPKAGTFDVVVRDFYDTDASPLILEKFSKCNMVEGDSKFVGFKIGTSDGSYVNKSKYITVEIADSENLESCVPAGFLGYPSLFGKDIQLTYNDKFDIGVKAKRQYFGLNKDVLDEDILNYQGYYAYSVNDTDPDKLTNGFHLDSILSLDDYKNNKDGILVDGVSGFTFSTVSTQSVSTNDKKIPRIIDGDYIEDTIYKDINTRKFTVYPYGGFDGWDINRGYRTNGNDFKASNYKVDDSSVFKNAKTIPSYKEMLKLGEDAITSDYYAFFAGYRQFANPQDIDINVFATPGIDWMNNTLLTEDALDIIEDKEDGRGGDALYIMDSPQYNDNGDALSVDDIVDELEGTQIDSSYACTYFPWIKYFDSSLNKYIDLPVTKDVVRNIADTDNNAYPWFAPAGINRGNVNCIMAVKKTTLDDEDDLYENRINPVKSFAQDGVKIWGNKTLYSSETSPLNRINVRRLMIRIKKLVVDAAQALIFEQYDTTLEKQFRSLVEPILADAKSNRGITDYRVETEVTAETMDQHILPAVIKVKPSPAVEWISISFVVYPQSVSFDEN